MAQARPCELRKGSKMAAVLLLLMSCGVSQAKTVDLAQWSAGGWRVTVDGVMGMLSRWFLHAPMCAGDRRQVR